MAFLAEPSWSFACAIPQVADSASFAVFVFPLLINSPIRRQYASSSPVWLYGLVMPVLVLTSISSCLCIVVFFHLVSHKIHVEVAALYIHYEFISLFTTSMPRVFCPLQALLALGMWDADIVCRSMVSRHFAHLLGHWLET